mmetsp:Transcript_27274/g.60088  ORF Transcript_27274/g.60088 Transcript_27274/m.60088 type:complete len:257 (-) Transcript_27274:2610-3380(-)
MLSQIYFVSFKVFQFGDAKQNEGSKFGAFLAANLGQTKSVIEQNFHPGYVSEMPFAHGPRDIELRQALSAVASQSSIRGSCHRLCTPEEDLPCLIVLPKRHFEGCVLAVGIGMLGGCSATRFCKESPCSPNVLKFCVVESPVQRNFMVPRKCGRSALVDTIRAIVGSVSSFQPCPVSKDTKKLVPGSILRNALRQTLLDLVGCCRILKGIAINISIRTAVVVVIEPMLHLFGSFLVTFLRIEHFFFVSDNRCLADR